MDKILEVRTGDFMTERPTTVDDELPVADVERIFETFDFNGLPVLRHGGLVGVVTKLDVLAAYGFQSSSTPPTYEDIGRRPIREFVTREPVTVDVETPLTRVLEQMVATHFKSFPVVDGGRLVGVIAREDVLRAIRSRR